MKRAQQHNIKLNIDDNDDKLHNSTFLLSISSNQAVTSMKDPFVPIFKNQIANVLRNLPDYVKVVGNAIPDPEMEITIKSAFEIGEKYHRLHSHSIVSINHDSRIQLDREKFDAKFENLYHVDFHFVKSSNDMNRMLRYLRKQA